MSVYDAEHLITSGINADVERFEDGDAINERIIEWLETPEGTVADIPSWGHNLLGFKHDPQGKQLEILMEMSIAQKLTKDIRDINLRGIRIEYLDIDMFLVMIIHQYGGTVSKLVL
jgi:hypothetical protein